MNSELVASLVMFFLWIIGGILSCVCWAYITIFTDHKNPFWDRTYHFKSPKIFQCICVASILVFLGPIGLIFTGFGFFINLWEYLKERDKRMYEQQAQEIVRDVERRAIADVERNMRIEEYLQAQGPEMERREQAEREEERQEQEERRIEMERQANTPPSENNPITSRFEIMDIQS